MQDHISKLQSMKSKNNILFPNYNLKKMNNYIDNPSFISLNLNTTLPDTKNDLLKYNDQ